MNINIIKHYVTVFVFILALPLIISCNFSNKCDLDIRLTYIIDTQAWADDKDSTYCIKDNEWSHREISLCYRIINNSNDTIFFPISSWYNKNESEILAYDTLRKRRLNVYVFEHNDRISPGDTTFLRFRLGRILYVSEERQDGPSSKELVANINITYKPAPSDFIKEQTSPNIVFVNDTSDLVIQHRKPGIFAD